MAKDVITRFKLETTQFDSKLRDTAKSLQNIAHQAELGGKDFNDFSQKAIEAARALGTVQSGANNTKDKLRDLVGSYNDAAKAYNSLSDAAKKGEFGKAMAASLEKLQQDIKDTKEEFYSLGEAVKEKSGLFGENGLTGMLQVFGGNLMTKGFEMIASGLKDTWTQSIELAKAGEGVRIAFERLNQPGLLDRLKEATHGTVSEVELMKQAIKFENFKLPLEDLATYLAFAQQKAKDTGESVDYMVNSITTGLGRQSKQILDNLGISAAELTKRMNEGADMTKAVADIIREEMAKAGDYVETAADKAARAAAKATDELEKFGQSAAPIAEEWGQVWNALSIGAMDFASTLLGPVAESIRSLQNIWNNGWEDNIINSPYNIEGKTPSRTGYQGMGNLQKVTATGGYVEMTDTNTGKVIGGQHFDNLNDVNAIKDWQKSLFKTKTTSSGNKQTLKIEFDINKAALAATKADPNANFISPWAMADKDKLRESLGIEKTQFDYKKDITEKDYKKLIGEQTDEKLYEAMDKLGGNIGKFAGGLGSISSGLKSMGVELPKEVDTVIGVISGLSQIITGVSTIIELFSTTSQAANTAAITANTVAMGGLIAAINANTFMSMIPGFAHGGIVPHAATGYIVPGNSFSGDNTPIMANAGEVVLTQAMAGNLASRLSDQGRGMNIVGEIQGEKIVLVANRFFKRTGQGEIVTW